MDMPQPARAEASIGAQARAEAHADMMRRAMLIARAAVIADIESECVAETVGAQRWWDTRPMLDAREHAPAVVDMARESLQYALDTAIVTGHPTVAHLVRINRRPGE